MPNDGLDAATVVISVGAITSGRNAPSARFRVRQYVGPLRAYGVAVTEYAPTIEKYAPIPGWPKRIRQRYALGIYLGWQCWKTVNRLPSVARSHRHDATWLQRELIPGLITLEPLLRRPIVLDVDDAIWETSRVARFFMPILAREASIVVAGNSYLANHLSQWSSRVEVIHTGLDTARFSPAASGSVGERRARGECVIGWTGSASTLGYLESLGPALSRVLLRYPKATLMVVADRSPRIAGIDPTRVRYVPWSQSNEAALVQQMDIGLMPLPDSPWTRGKCSFKMIQYMACGLPCVVSPVGLNAEILALAQVGLAATSDAEWERALDILIRRTELRDELGRSGRRIAMERFDSEQIAAQLGRVFGALRV